LSAIALLLCSIRRSWHDQQVTATYDDGDRSNHSDGAVASPERVNAWPATQAHVVVAGTTP
jgi:hypothetical protein